MRALLLGLALAAAGWTGAGAETGERFTVEVRGRGPDVVLIPGLASSRAVWTATAERLDDTRRVHLIQVNGFAAQPAGANASGPVVAPLVEELAAYIERKGLKAPAVIGHSLGGEAALMLAAQHPARVGRVMVVDALPFFSLLINPAATAESVRPQADAARDGLLRLEPAAYAAAQRAGLGRLVKDPAARARHGEAAAASDPGVVARAMHEIMVTDLRPELPRITAPVTVLYAYDPAYGVPASAIDGLFRGAYAGLKGASLKRVDGAFHFIMDDQPARFAAEVDAFLAAP